MYFTIEASNAWGASTFITEDGKWTFKRSEAKRFKTLEEAQNFKNEGTERAKLAKLGTISAYRED